MTLRWDVRAPRQRESQWLSIAVLVGLRFSSRHRRQASQRQKLHEKIEVACHRWSAHREPGIQASVHLQGPPRDHPLKLKHAKFDSKG